MQQIQNILRQASRRLTTARFLSRTHLLAMFGAAVFLLMVLADRFTSAALPLAWMGVGLGAVVILAAWLWAFQTRPSHLAVALLVDERLELDERLSTALQCHGIDDSFARAAVEDGITVAKTPGLYQRINERFVVAAPRRAWVAPLLVAVAVLFSLMPSRDIFARDPGPDPEELETALEISYEIDRQSDTIEALAQELEDRVGIEQGGEGTGGDIELPRGDAPIDQLRDNLRRITELKERLEAMQQSDQMKALERLEDSLRQLKTPGDGPASKLSDALQQSDFDSAQDELQKMQEKLAAGAMSEADQEALAKQMESLAQQLEELAKEQQEKLKEALKQAGLDPSLASSPEALKQALEEASNLSEAQKQALQQMAQQNAAMQKQMSSMSQACQNACQACENGNPSQLSSALETMASTLSQMGDMKQGATLSKEALDQLQKMAAACGSCMGSGDGEGGGDQIMITQGAVELGEWKEAWLEELSQGKGGGPNPGTGAGGEMPKSETRFRMQEEQLKTFMNENGAIVAQQLVQGTQIRGDSKVRLQEILTEISEGLEEGVNEEWVPREYQEAVKAYFSNLRQETGASPEPAEAEPADGGAESEEATASEVESG
jgi:hypothetical protein